MAALDSSEVTWAKGTAVAEKAKSKIERKDRNITRILRLASQLREGDGAGQRSLPRRQIRCKKNVECPRIQVQQPRGGQLSRAADRLREENLRRNRVTDILPPR